MSTAYLGLGSNLGDRALNLAQALRRLAEPGDVRVEKVSSIYQTAPVGRVDQPEFYNLTVKVFTDLGPAELLARALEAEAALGRVRRERWGPRVLDIDLLWYDNRTIASADLMVPHPRMLERAFVLIPLAEIAPDLVIAGETVAARASVIGATGVARVGSLAGWEKGGSSAPA